MILKIFGGTALAAGILLNVQLISESSDYRTPLNYLKSIAYANSENDWNDDEDDCDNIFFGCNSLWQGQLGGKCSYQICPVPNVYCYTREGSWKSCVDGPDWCLPGCEAS